MSLFSIEGFLKALGFDAIEFEATCKLYQSEFAAMKAGLQQAVHHFSGELQALRKENKDLYDAIERLDQRVDRLLTIADVTYTQVRTSEHPLTPEFKPNGHDKHGTERAAHREYDNGIDGRSDD